MEWPSSHTTCKVCVTIEITLAAFVNQRYILFFFEKPSVYYIFLLSAQS